MGNTESKFDKVLKKLCVLTNGFLGKSEEGYHIGPLRVTERSVGFKLRCGIFNLGGKIGKNESGKWEAEASVGIGISQNAEIELKAKVDNDFNVKLCPKASVNTNFGNFSAGVEIDISKGKISSGCASVTKGPVSLDVGFQNSQDNQYALHAGGSLDVQVSDRYSLLAYADTTGQYSLGASVGVGDVTQSHGVLKGMMDNKGHFSPQCCKKYVAKSAVKTESETGHGNGETKTENGATMQDHSSAKPKEDSGRINADENAVPEQYVPRLRKLNKKSIGVGDVTQSRGVKGMVDNKGQSSAQFHKKSVAKSVKTESETESENGETKTGNSVTMQDLSSAKPKKASGRMNADENAVPLQDVVRSPWRDCTVRTQGKPCKICGKVHGYYA